MKNSPDNITASIEAWFRANDDGDFCSCPDDHNSSLTGDHSHARTIIYTTKCHCLPRIRVPMLEPPVAIIGRYGLPSKDDLALISQQEPSVNRVFIGDADPPDLLIFAWLRQHVPIHWYGVNDDFLIRHDNRANDHIQLLLSDSERAAVLELPRLCPDFRDLLGPYCSSLLGGGFKIELEGAIIDAF